MEILKSKTEEMLRLMGFKSFTVSAESLLNKISATVEDAVAKDHLADLVLSINALLRVMAKKEGGKEEEPIIFDMNNYRKERDALIIDLAKAAARKTVGTKEAVQLPPMNAYERRLVHAELSMRPDVMTESIGEGKSRYVVVKLAE